MSILKPQPMPSKVDVAKTFAEAKSLTTSENRSSNPPTGEVRVIFNVPKSMRTELKAIALREETTVSELLRESVRELIEKRR